MIEVGLKHYLNVTFCRMNAKRSYFKQNKNCYCDDPMDCFLCGKQPIKSADSNEEISKIKYFVFDDPIDGVSSQ